LVRPSAPDGLISTVGRLPLVVLVHSLLFQCFAIAPRNIGISAKLAQSVRVSYDLTTYSIQEIVPTRGTFNTLSQFIHRAAGFTKDESFSLILLDW